VAPQDDRELISRFKEGDRLAFKELVVRYQQRVFAVAYGIVRDEEAALDIAQETFIKAHKNLHTFQGASSFYSWLYRIATNLSIDYRRAQKRTKEHTEYDDQRKLGEEAEQAAYLTPAYSRSNPAKELEQREIAKLLDVALEQLSDKLRAVFVLREVEGLSYQEIADAVGIPIGSVMSRLFHARQRLAEFLRPHLENSGVAARLGVDKASKAPKAPKEKPDE
jgi:RNA polymerase sigma-70 factor (ECF subfamily)